MIDLRTEQQERLLAYAQEHGYTDASPRYASCRIVIGLAQPIGGYDHNHLDALLQSAVVLDALQGEPLVPQATPYTIPLPLEVLWRSERGTPLYHCSSLLPSGGVKQSVFTWTKKNDESISRFSTRKRDGTEWQPDNGSGQNKEYRVGLPVKSTRQLIGYAVGDIDEIKRLLAMIPRIGKKTAWGLGEIVSRVIEPCRQEHRYCFIRDGMLLRPVPVQACEDLGIALTGDPQLVGYTPPYWLPLNQTNCHIERHIVSSRPTKVTSSPHLSIPQFLHYCYLADGLRHPSRGDVILQHAKYQHGKGIGQLCALTGLPITDEGAVPSKLALSDNMGNVVDFCHAPYSKWVSNAAAVILGLPKQMHRNLVALIHPDPDKKEAHLLWPSLAVDPTNPKQARPLWREVLIALNERYQGYRCILIFKDEPKSRTWPRARVGMVGEHTPLLFSDGKFGIEAVLQINIAEALTQMCFIEELLDAGYGKTEISAGLKSPSIDRLIETLAIEKKLSMMRTTPEFPFAWYIARTKEDRAIRKDIYLELD